MTTISLDELRMAAAVERLLMRGISKDEAYQVVALAWNLRNLIPSEEITRKIRDSYNEGKPQ